ncbi:MULTISPECIES: FHA domain-containing protein [Kytococcus]|uniref:FHA domain-containing protein n=1 Tax=Kytococcus schroeteri TaxID=138300 RepID=A0A2I1PDN9_9MICO|nr:MULTISPECIES: FHA domain-containing protein [Kytococcus]OFS11014.1 hypothetical protein HMPREF3099_08215 [Kytococcus sp. HMSC28H12]PKZ42735.1 FHA domain-containing protein [Kytococcus schroeteri]
MSSTPGGTPHATGPATSRIDLATGSPVPTHPRTPVAMTDVDAQMIAALRPGTALLLIPAGASAGARYLLDEPETTVGRAADADILLDDVTVSRHHARFVLSQEGCRLVDSKSTNGTYVNGEPVEQVDLQEGDEVQIGKYRLVFHPATSPVA